MKYNNKHNIYNEWMKLITTLCRVRLNDFKYPTKEKKTEIATIQVLNLCGSALSPHNGNKNTVQTLWAYGRWSASKIKRWQTNMPSIIRVQISIEGDNETLCSAWNFCHLPQMARVCVRVFGLKTGGSYVVVVVVLCNVCLNPGVGHVYPRNDL